MNKLFLRIHVLVGLLVLSVADVSDHEKHLEKIIGDGENRLWKVLDEIKAVRGENDKIVEERTDILIDMYHRLNGQIHGVVQETVAKSIHSKSAVNKHPCIATTASKVISSMNQTFQTIPETAANLKNNAVLALSPFKDFLLLVHDFLMNLKNEKTKALNETQSTQEINKILEDVAENAKTVIEVCDSVTKRIEKEKYAFFEGYVNFIHNTEKVFKKDHSSGVKKILKCLA